MSNYTIPINPFSNTILKTECVNLCREQYIQKDFSGLWIIYISTLSLFLYFILLHWQNYFTKYINVNIYYKLLQMLNRFSLYLQIGFIIYIIFFRV